MAAPVYKKPIKATCYGCVRRQVGCHSHCEDYISFRKKMEEEKKASIEHNRLENTFWDRYNHKKARHMYKEKR